MPSAKQAADDAAKKAADDAAAKNAASPAAAPKASVAQPKDKPADTHKAKKPAPKQSNDKGKGKGKDPERPQGNDLASNLLKSNDDALKIGKQKVKKYTGINADGIVKKVKTIREQAKESVKKSLSESPVGQAVEAIGRLGERLSKSFEAAGDALKRSAGVGEGEPASSVSPVPMTPAPGSPNAADAAQNTQLEAKRKNEEAEKNREQPQPGGSIQNDEKEQLNTTPGGPS